MDMLIECDYYNDNRIDSRDVLPYRRLLDES